MPMGMGSKTALLRGKSVFYQRSDPIFFSGRKVEL
jgi:hypothetical protein